MTLYRTGASSDVVNALADAARAGKEVTVVIELRARFDEEANLHLASLLQEAGAVVTYGVVSHKTHAKTLLIVRREAGQLRRYCHLGTGNYHSGNARQYTDYSLLTSDSATTDELAKIFRQLTGMGKVERPGKLLTAPFNLRKTLLRLIEGEMAAAREGKKSHIILKINGLTEPKTIKMLYRASQAGVKIDLIVRGMCCLRPGVPGISDNISVRSIVGRFLEHSRVYCFANAQPGIYCSSADLMERNLIDRVEIAFPIESKKLSGRILAEMEAYLADNCQSWELQPDGSYLLNQPAEDAEERVVQAQLLERWGG
jgi:polyphosphate kinase